MTDRIPEADIATADISQYTDFWLVLPTSIPGDAIKRAPDFSSGEWGFPRRGKSTDVDHLEIAVLDASADAARDRVRSAVRWRLEELDKQG